MSFIEDSGYFVFDGIKSSDYGVWIHGGGTYDAPARRYKEYTVPGRNGSLTVDDGAYEEAKVVYPAFIANGFASNVESFRNELLSRSGYVRMTDSYHPDEFYLAKYVDGLEVDTAPGSVGGSFNLTFRRDPRRFLLTGETAVTYPPGIDGNGTNILEYPYVETTKTWNGVTYTDIGDGQIYLNGRSSASGSTFVCWNWQTNGISFEAGDYILTGGINTDCRLYIYKRSGDTSYSVIGTDTGNGAQFTVTDSTAIYGVVISIPSQRTVDYTVKPMIRSASVTDDTWEPYWTGATAIYNPTLHTANPTFRVVGAGVVTIGTTDVTIASHSMTYIDIDSEIQDCYCGTSNANQYVTFEDNKFPTFEPGVTNIVRGDGITSVTVTPRWWIL